MRKPISAQELAKQSLRADPSQKSLTLHQALKQLTNCFLICKECFDNGNYPKVFNPEEFQPTTLRSLLYPDQHQNQLSNSANKEADTDRKDDHMQQQLEE